MTHHHNHHAHRAEFPNAVDTGAAGMRASKVSLLVLGLTAAIQLMIAWASGSVALYSDTLHNLTDALTAVPLWIAFSVGRRQPTQRYTYGFHRAEDLVGVLILVVVVGSALFVIAESFRRLFDPRTIDHIPWVIAAGLIGAASNEFVARYRMRVGRAIGSEALTADGQHARADALTSLAVVAAGVGSALGADLVDPIAGLVVGVAILWLFAGSARRIMRRLLDGIDPGIIDRVQSIILEVEGVEGVSDLRARWHGHQLQVTASIVVESEMSVEEGHHIAEAVAHELDHEFEIPVVAVIHVDPQGLEHSH